MPDLELDIPTPVNDGPRDPAAAIESLNKSVADGEAPTSGPDTGSSSAADPSATSTPPAAEKRGPGRPPKKSNETITGARLKDLKKEEINTLLTDRERELREERQKTLELTLELDRATAAKSVDVKTEIDDAIAEMAGGAVDTISALAVAQYGPVAAINREQRERVVTPATRVGKMYLGQHAKWSPEAALFISIVSVASEKYADVKLAGAQPAKMTLVSEG